jgi:hypothetical protein
MKYLYTIHYLEYSEYHNADFDCSVSVIDKNGELGERALKNRVEDQVGFRPDRITRIECMCYAN